MDPAKEKLAIAILRAPKGDSGGDSGGKKKPGAEGRVAAMKKLGAALKGEDWSAAADAFDEAFQIYDGYGTNEGE